MNGRKREERQNQERKSPPPSKASRTPEDQSSWLMDNKLKVAAGLLTLAGGVGGVSYWLSREEPRPVANVRQVLSLEEEIAQGNSSELKKIIDEGKKAAIKEGKPSLVILCEQHTDPYCAFLANEAIRHSPKDNVIILETHLKTLREEIKSIELIEKMEELKAKANTVSPENREELQRYIREFDDVNLGKDIAGQAYLLRKWENERNIVTAARKPSEIAAARARGEEVKYAAEAKLRIDEDLIQAGLAQKGDAIMVAGLLHSWIARNPELNKKFHITLVNITPRQASDEYTESLHIAATKEGIKNEMRKGILNTLERTDFALENAHHIRVLDTRLKYPFSSTGEAIQLSDRFAAAGRGR